ncbi:MAG TPA: helix-turn-helix domain-containing protein [Methylomirabilota bacterium]|nr:helix-turn-helix domain-containing protein [Methylomirabilota bacterium]
MVPKDTMSVQECSQYLSMDEQTITAMAAERRIPCLNQDGKWLFSKKSIDKWKARQAPARA